MSHPSDLEVSPACLLYINSNLFFYQDILAESSSLLLTPSPSTFFSTSNRSRASIPGRMDLGDGLQEELLGNSPSLSSDSSWTSFDCSTDLTSVSSDLALTPVTAPSCCKLFDASIPKSKSSSAKASSGERIRKVAWRETSFLGDDE